MSKIELGVSLVEVIGPILLVVYANLKLTSGGAIDFQQQSLGVHILGFYGLIGGIFFWIHMMVKGFRDQGTFGFYGDCLSCFLVS